MVVACHQITVQNKQQAEAMLKQARVELLIPAAEKSCPNDGQAANNQGLPVAAQASCRSVMNDKNDVIDLSFY